jgi:hypothetical protein
LISVTISTDKTIVYWDNWEDGYEADATQPTQTTTKVWGDGNAANGCRPDLKVACTNANDVLKAGDAIVIQETIPLPRKTTDIRMDGGDRIQATMPVAVTRGAYPANPGSLMAGAVEVFDTLSGWGKSFIAPTGVDADIASNAFEYTALYVMASENDTTLTLKNGSTVKLNMGESVALVDVKIGDTVLSDKLVQVTLVTGDKNSNYEMRWYTLLPTEMWSTSYVSPVGDSTGQTKILLYNPDSTKSITVKYQWLDTLQNIKTTTATIPAGKSFMTNNIPTGSGAFLDSDSKFVALSLTDTLTNSFSSGQIYDW